MPYTSGPSLVHWNSNDKLKNSARGGCSPGKGQGMTSLIAAHDPARDTQFGEFQLIPILKPRPSSNPSGSRRSAARRPGSAGMIANAFLTGQALVKIVRDGGVTTLGRLGGQLSYITRRWSVATPESCLTGWKRCAMCRQTRPRTRSEWMRDDQLHLSRDPVSPEAHRSRGRQANSP